MKEPVQFPIQLFATHAFRVAWDPLLLPPQSDPPLQALLLLPCDVQHPTLVSSRNSKTTPVALTSHNLLTTGALGCFHSQSLRTLFHSLLT